MIQLLSVSIFVFYNHTRAKFTVLIVRNIHWCISWQARIQRGGGGPGVRTPPPPLRFVRGGVLWRGLIGRRGGPTIDFSFLSFFFWLASLASIIQTYIICLHTSKFNVQYGMVILSLYIFVVPLSKLWKESNFPSLAFMKGYFHIFLV